MSFQDDVAAIAAEHGMDVAVEYAAQSFDALDPFMRLGDILRDVWRKIGQPLLSYLSTAVLSGAATELDYYTEVSA